LDPLSRFVFFFFLNLLQINPNEAHNYGCLVEDKTTHEIIHFAEKPETFVSDLANCGVYIFSTHIFQLVENVAARLRSAEENIYNERPLVDPLCPLCFGCSLLLILCYY
jgi:mannose-1-phosphate guanylyltransferase